MTVYNLIKDYRLPLIILRRFGYVSSSLARDLKVYEAYLKDGGRNVANIEIIAAEHKISTRQVYRIINKLSKKP